MPLPTVMRSGSIHTKPSGQTQPQAAQTRTPHFICNQQNVVALQHFLNLFPVSRRRRNDAPRPDTGSPMNAPLVSGLPERDEPLDCFAQATHENSLLVDATLRAAGNSAASSWQHRPRRRQIERTMMVIETREASRHHSATVIPQPPARDDLFLIRPAQHIVVVPDDLELGFVSRPGPEGYRTGCASSPPAPCRARGARGESSARSR